MARRHESLIPLSHQHHDALMLAWRLRTGNLSKRESELRAKHVSAFFEYRLMNHMRLEEELLYPACRAVLGVEASLIDVLLSDHRELRAKAAASRPARTTRWTVSASCSNAISEPRNVNCLYWPRIG